MTVMKGETSIVTHISNLDTHSVLSLLRLGSPLRANLLTAIIVKFIFSNDLTARHENLLCLKDSRRGAGARHYCRLVALAS